MRSLGIEDKYIEAGKMKQAGAFAGRNHRLADPMSGAKQQQPLYFVVLLVLTLDTDFTEHYTFNAHTVPWG